MASGDDRRTYGTGLTELPLRVPHEANEEHTARVSSLSLVRYYTNDLYIVFALQT